MKEALKDIQAQLNILVKKLDNLINQNQPNDHHKQRMTYDVICADCKKECSIPFKPSGDRPVYCKDCFSRRKVISMSGMKMDDKPKEAAPVQTAVNKPVEIKKSLPKTKKKAIIAKKPVAKKKTTPKKK